nr:MAG TPA: MerF Protein [Caudoviricetes sp.]
MVNFIPTPLIIAVTTFECCVLPALIVLIT